MSKWSSGRSATSRAPADRPASATCSPRSASGSFPNSGRSAPSSSSGRSQPIRYSNGSLGMRVELRISGIVALLACVVLAACSGGQPTSGGAPSAKATATTTPAAALHCKLPVTAGQTASQQAGFISFPSGSFAADASSGTSYEIATMRYRTTQSPVLYGDSSSGTYDTAAGRWLPVAWTQVLPDGSAYAYTREASPTQSRNEIHVVDVATA